MKQIEKRNWNFNNASVAYVFAIVGYFCASILLTVIVLAATAGAIAIQPDSANDILSLPWVTYLNIILSELSFLLVFLICNKKYKKEFFVASRIKCKPNALIIVGRSNSFLWQHELIRNVYAFIFHFCKRSLRTRSAT